MPFEVTPGLLYRRRSDDLNLTRMVMSSRADGTWSYTPGGRLVRVFRISDRGLTTAPIVFFESEDLLREGSATLGYFKIGFEPLSALEQLADVAEDGE